MKFTNAVSESIHLYNISQIWKTNKLSYHAITRQIYEKNKNTKLNMHSTVLPSSLFSWGKNVD